jgi:signal transduction histidine kinase
MPYRSIEDPVKLRRVLEATLLLEGDLDLPVLLRHVVEEARSIAGAQYGALGVLNDDRTGLDQFITVGLEPDEESRIGDRPTGRGVLGLLITDPRPVRLAELGAHPDSFGFPPNHPPMTSFLGVPIKVRGEVYGNLYLTGKIGWSEFTQDDEALVGVLALAAGIAVENTRLHARVQRVAVFEDRDRVARDLHDTVIQRLFAVGLSLQAMSTAVAAEGLADRLNRAISDLDDTIRQVRSTIYELGMTGEEQGLRARFQALGRDLGPVLGFKLDLSFDGPVDSAVSDQIAEHVLTVAREGVTNVARHAHATCASVKLGVSGGMCRLEIADNGQGFPQSSKGRHGFGLANLQHRAEKLHGTFAIDDGEEGGTLLTWQVPLDQSVSPA